jgi:hypothetical protein
MSKNWIMLTGLLLLGSVGTLQAHPLDAPDIVYIDGQPCNSACQSYLAWSWRRTSRHVAPVESPPAESPPAKATAEKPAHRPAKSAISRAASAHREGSRPAKPRPAKQAAPLPPAEVATLQPAADAAVKSEPAPASVAALPSADGAAAAPQARTIQEQVAAATALAVQVTAASAPQQEAAEASIFAGTAGAGDAGSTASIATDNRDSRVALLMTRPEITAVSDLSGKDVAIEDQQSASSASIRAAIASAGAAEVQLNEKNVKAVDRLVGGEVPAAVVALVSAEAAQWFPDIPGYRIFRIPLAADPSKARL